MQGDARQRGPAGVRHRAPDGCAEEQHRAERAEGGVVLAGLAIRLPEAGAAGDGQVHDPRDEAERLRSPDRDERREERQRDDESEDACVAARPPLTQPLKERHEHRDDRGRGERGDQPVRERREVEEPVEDVQHGVQAAGEGRRGRVLGTAAAVAEQVARCARG